jgi:undecaprenyl-diphosphatase
LAAGYRQGECVDEILSVIVLGIIEGVTEFLPISSTGHLIAATALLNFDAAGSAFEIFIQLGAVFAVIGYFSRDLFHQVRTVPSDQNVQRLWMSIIIAFIPAAGIGFLLSDWIDAVLFNPRVVAFSLIIGGIVFLLIERRKVDEKALTTALQSVTPRQALLIGLAQTVALIPGVSRSGASIIGGMLAGLNRQVATQFSFYLAIPTLGLAAIYSLLKQVGVLTRHDLILLTLGTVISGIVAWIAIAWLLRFVARNNFVVFGYYRIVIGFIILALSFTNVL